MGSFLTPSLYVEEGGRSGPSHRHGCTALVFLCVREGEKESAQAPRAPLYVANFGLCQKVASARRGSSKNSMSI